MLASAFLRLPRDARDTLFILVVLLWVALPQFRFTPLWCGLACAAVLGWRAILAWRGMPLPPKWLVGGLLLAAVVSTALTYRTLLGQDAGVCLLLLLLVLKTLELRARRDAFVLFFVGFFLLLAQFFHSQSLLTAAGMLAGLLGLLTALVHAHRIGNSPALRQSAYTAGRILLWATPLMLLLFLFFPRLSPLWGTPGNALTGRSGLSGSMTVGDVTHLALDDGIAMRIRFAGPIPDPTQLYFRGPVLWAFDGRTWRARNHWMVNTPLPEPELRIHGNPVRYQVTQEPNRLPWLPVLEAAVAIEGQRAVMTRDLQWLHPKPIMEVLRYDVESYPHFEHGPRTAEPSLLPFQWLPTWSNPRTQAWAAQLRNDPRNADNTALDWAQFALNHLRQGGYRYTLDVGIYGLHSADEYWFDRKLGFCEHIASSFVILLRALGIPARVVTGYQGGERNPIDGLWTVRHSDAHAWAELWMPGRGWFRIDPTAVVAPARIGTLQRAPMTLGNTALFERVHPRLAWELRALWDAANTRWNDWVLHYGQTRQFDLLRNLGFDSPSWQHLGIALFGTMATIAAVWAALRYLLRQRQDPWLRLFHAVTTRLRQRGWPLPVHPTPRGIAALLALQPTPALQGWLLRMETLRYAPPKPQQGSLSQQLAALRREWKRLAKAVPVHTTSG
ncbi:transglutaminaseTgpA domain-containing protein [Candidatus Symbiobacter mobilis]|uniref:transglutaminase family protein n=1 Tax=Candidatus Symbiobacter mobilis TaxID=1436290 RepID=UPI00059C75BC|nr:DUF3488 and transglutaminase-like domain-containing protein [Candidatus Symbiobacter mobilis]